MHFLISAKIIRKNWLIQVGEWGEELKLSYLMCLYNKVKCVCVQQRADWSPLITTAGYFNICIDNQVLMTIFPLGIFLALDLA